MSLLLFELTTLETYKDTIGIRHHRLEGLLNVYSDSDLIKIQIIIFLNFNRPELNAQNFVIFVFLVYQYIFSNCIFCGYNLISSLYLCIFLPRHSYKHCLKLVYYLFACFLCEPSSYLYKFLFQFFVILQINLESNFSEKTRNISFILN